jgi:hypothetical protein
MAVRTVSSGWTWTSDGRRSPLLASTASTVVSLGPHEPVVGHPTVVVELGEVPAARVGDEDDDDVVGTERPADLEGGPHGGAGRTADQDPLLPVTRRAVRNESLIGHGHHPVDHRGVVGGGPEVLADPLDQVGPAPPPE